MKIIIILVFQIWIISVYISDSSYFDDLLNENKTNNNPEDNPNKDITNLDIPKKSNRFNEEKFYDKIHKGVDIYVQTKLMGIFNHAFNLMFKQIEENFGNVSEEFDQILLKSKKNTLEHTEFHSQFNKLHTNKNNLTSLVDQLQLKYNNLAVEIP